MSTNNSNPNETLSDDDYYNSYENHDEELLVWKPVEVDERWSSLVNRYPFLHGASLPELQSAEENITGPDFELWRSKVSMDPWRLANVPDHIRSNRFIVFDAVNQDSYALFFAAPEIQKDKSVVIAAVTNKGKALEFADPQLQKDREVVMVAIQNDKTGRAIKFASPKLQSDRKVAMAAARRIEGLSLKFATPDLKVDEDFMLQVLEQDDGAFRYIPPLLQNKKSFVVRAIGRNCSVLQHTSPEMKNDKQIMMTAVRQDGLALQLASPDIRNDRQIIVAAIRQNGSAIQYVPQNLLRKDKDVVVAAVAVDPDYIKFVCEDLKRDPEVLVAACMFDRDHDDAVIRQQRRDTRKIVLSTRFSLTSSSFSEANNFTSLFKNAKFIQEGNFVVYAPNAFDKKTCDSEWTNFDHPCRGTKDTCEYNNVTTDAGYPTDDCCWRYSFRQQLQEAKDTEGFMLQLVETVEQHGKARDAIPGMGQSIELDMAQSVGIKVFQVYCPTYGDEEYWFEDRHIGVVTAAIFGWYDDDQCKDSSVFIIHQAH